MINASIVSGIADLAEAAYIDFGEASEEGLAGTKLAENLEGLATWPAARRNTFTAEWRVVAHKPNTSSGFSATVFERIAPKAGG